MPYNFLLISREESVRRGSFFNKTARFTPSSQYNWKIPVLGEGGGGVVCEEISVGGGHFCSHRSSIDLSLMLSNSVIC